MQIGLYIASVIGAIALLLIMPKKGFSLPKLGALLGAAALGGVWLFIVRAMPGWLEEGTGLPVGALPYYYIFSALSIAAGVRVITHTKPVFSALWFVMVVLSSAGLFLTLGAEFMALAIIIIYGGAILVTYVFVIMLASHSATEADDSPQPHDSVARAPVGAVAAGFILLATLLSVVFHPDQLSQSPVPAARSATDRQLLEGNPATGEPRVLVAERRAPGRFAARLGGEDAETRAAHEAQMRVHELTNVERVGLDLFRSNPLGLELAGVILLLALVGAVIISRLRVDEEEHSSQ